MQSLMDIARYEKTQKYNYLKSVKYPRRRYSHASCIYGGVLLISGGLTNDSVEIYDDFHALDLGLGTWIRCK